jgi:NAD(P)-dependent dehydrogenase (short-subunit alcohol dehydrogenase family)
VTTLSGKTCLVTGATSGIGKETALRLAMLGATVIVPARDPARGRAVRDELRQRVPGAQIDTLAADLSTLDQVRRLAEEILARHERLDVLVNNAGIISTRRQVTPDGYEATFATNHLAPFLLTNLLRELLERSAPARVVTVASAAHRQVRTIPWDDLPYAAHTPIGQTYPLSKLCNILFTVELSRQLTGTGVTANSLHPGFVRTALGRDVTGLPAAALRLALRLVPGAATGARTSVYLATSPEVAQESGRYYVSRRPAKPSALASSAEAAERLWSLSEGLCGLHPAP